MAVAVLDAGAMAVLAATFASAKYHPMTLTLFALA